MVWLGLAGQHFVDGQQHLRGLQCWPEVPQLFYRTGRLRAAGSQASLPVAPGHTGGWTDLVGGQRRVDGRIQFHRPAYTPPPLVVRRELQIQGCQIVLWQ
jgi:hypothetical protein